MRVKCSVFIATTLDGYIARKDGALDWLPGGDGSDTAEDYGYRDFVASVDTLVMGRNTYELVLSFGEWPYPDKRVVVLSSRYPGELHPLAVGVEGASLPPHRLVDRLGERGARHLYVDGGKTIQGFLRAGLIDEMTITRVPILIGDGIPLFGALEGDIRLRHRSTRIFEDGMVQSRYGVASKGD